MRIKISDEDKSIFEGLNGIMLRFSGNIIYAESYSKSGHWFISEYLRERKKKPLDNPIEFN